MKLLHIENISFKNLFVVSDNIDTNDPTINDPAITNINNNQFDNYHLKNNIINSFQCSTIDSSTTDNSSNNNNNNNKNNNDHHLFHVYYKESYSKDINNTDSDTIKSIQFSFSDIKISINNINRDKNKMINHNNNKDNLFISIIMLFLLILKRDYKEFTESTFQHMICFNSIFHILDKEDYLNFTNFMIEINKLFPSYGIINTNIHLKMNSRLYSNDIGLSLYLDFTIYEYIPIDKYNIKYPILCNYIKYPMIENNNNNNYNQNLYENQDNTTNYSSRTSTCNPTKKRKLNV